MALELIFNPFEEHFDMGFTVGESMQAFAIADQLVFANVGFGVVERADLLQRG